MPALKNKQPYYVAGALLAACGLVIWAAAASRLHLYLTPEIKPVELVTLAVTVFIAYYLQFYFASRATDSRAEKDLLIDDLREVVDIARQCRDTVIQCHEARKISPKNAASIVAFLRRIANGLENVESALNMSLCSSLARECQPIKDALFTYKAAATGGNFPSKPYDAQTYSYQEQTYRALMQSLHSLVFKINQYR